MKSNVPGITKVGTLPARSLQPDIMLQAMAGIKVEIFKAPKWLKAVKRAKIQTEEDQSEGDTVQKAKLTFFSTEHIDAEEPLAFIALTADGRTLLIGTAEPPFPAVKSDISTGIPGSETAGCEYEIDHTAKIAVIEAGL